VKSPHATETLSSPTPPLATRWLALIALVWLAILAVAHYRNRGPDFLERGTDNSRFVGGNALDLLKQIFLPEQPHPAGSEANQKVRESIRQIASAWGYEVLSQETELARRPNTAPIPLTNLMFRLEGSNDSDDAIVVMAHYDSVSTGPGIGDDASGVAVLLELARMARQLPARRNDIIFLLTDGEEFGLLGARQFSAEHPWMKHAKLVINLEARGTSGPSLMFQTGQPNRWLIELFARNVSHPRTSSLFFEVYRFLPNDTDFTIFNRAGVNGFNFAFIGDVKNYHTENDNLEQLSRYSLQHHGDNAWEVLRPLADADLTATRSGNAVYFDLFCHWLVWWPAGWTLPIAGLLCGLMLVCSRGLGWKLLLRWGSDLLTILLALLVTAGLGHLLSWDARMKFPWPAAPFSLLMTYWLVALSLLLGLSRLIGPCCGLGMSGLASGWLWSLLAVLLAWLLPGASYLFIVPAVSLTLALAAGRRWPKSLPWGLFISAIVLGCLWIPNEDLFYQALGFIFPTAVAFRAVFAGAILLPWFGQLSSRAAWRSGLLLVTAAVAFAAIAIAQNRAVAA
jgi:hypothetical protein